MVDDTGFPKQGAHSVGVARQYCGQLGKQDNCRVAVSLSVANDHASLPVAWRLYLPEAWAEDPPRRAKAGVPEEIGFETRTAIALGQLRRAREAGVPAGIVLGDAGYGDETDFRVGVSGLDLRCVLGIRPGTRVWPPGHAPLPPAPWSGRGRPPTRLRRGPEHQPVPVNDLAASLPRRARRGVTWREGSRAALTSRFAARRVRPAHRDTLRSEPWPEEWLLIEWPEGAEEPSRCWPSNLPPRVALKDLVHAAKARWRIERDYRELKQGSASVTTRAAAGAASTTTPASPSPPTASSWPSAAFSPLSPASPAAGSRHLRYPKASGRAVPARPERHVPHSIATIRRRPTAGLVRVLPRCPCRLRKQNARKINVTQ